MCVELLAFAGCPNRERAEAMLLDAMDRLRIDAPVVGIEVPDEEAGRRVCFPGSPAIRIDGHDVEPANDPCVCEDCTPRCRVYPTTQGLRGLPEPGWIEAAFRRVLARAPR